MEMIRTTRKQKKHTDGKRSPCRMRGDLSFLILIFYFIAALSTFDQPP